MKVATGKPAPTPHTPEPWTWGMLNVTKLYPPLGAALRDSVVLIDDLLHQYAYDQCDPVKVKVKEAFARMSDKGGTLYYIATQKANRAALAPVDSGKEEKNV